MHGSVMLSSLTQAMENEEDAFGVLCGSFHGPLWGLISPSTAQPALPVVRNFLVRLLRRCLPELTAQLEGIGDEGCTGLDMVLDQFCLG